MYTWFRYWIAKKLIELGKCIENKGIDMAYSAYKKESKK